MGFLIQGAYIVTSGHLFTDKTSKVFVTIPNKGEYASRLIAIDADRDIALLKLEGTDQAYPYFNLGRHQDLNKEQNVHTTEGTVKITGLDTSIIAGQSFVTKDLDHLIQFEPAACLGCSGIPLYNSDFEVLGMVVSTQPNGKSGHAISVNTIKDFLKELDIPF